MNIWKTLHKWHRAIGITVVVFVVMLVVTGIMLNHTKQLNLNVSYIQNDLLLDWYDIQPKQDPVGYQIDDVWISQIGDRVYFDQKEIDNHAKSLYGVIRTDGIIVVAIDNRLVLLTSGGEIVERLGGTEGVPAGMQAIGISREGDVVIKAAHGYYRADLDELEWEESDFINAIWAETETIPPVLFMQLIRLYRGTGLPLERIILDLHSGRLLGSWGVYVIDAAAVLLLLLSISGFWMWLLYRK